MITDGKSQRLTAVEELDRESWVSQALLSDVSSEQLVFTGEDLEASHSWWSVDPATGTTASRGFSGVGYTLLPRWVRLRLTSVATKIHYVDDAKLLKWARDTTKKAKMANKARAANSRYANYRGVFNKGGNSKPAGNEYTVVLGISSFFTMTVGEGLALVIAFQLLLIMGMITYGVVMDRY